MVLSVNTSKKVMKSYKYRKGKGVVAKVARLSKQVHDAMPSRKVVQSRIVAYSSNTGNFDQNGTVGCAQVPLPSTGTSFGNRQNPYIHLHKIELMGTVITTATSDTIRFVLIQMVEAFEAGINVNFINPQNTSTAAPYNPLQPSVLCSQRYRVLYDSGPMNCGTTGGLKAQHSFRKTINMKGQKISFGSATTAIPQQNNIYCVSWGEQNPGAGPTYITTTICDSSFQLTFSG